MTKGDCAVRIAVRQRPLSESEKALQQQQQTSSASSDPAASASSEEDFIQRAGDMADNVRGLYFF